ncbi:hypothetical protein Bpfe_018187 [Biomphalaria pfeifferi]|uniref:Uncharacterized protein n=1 Tax=Biomphalaria pfeifferi TaxID=112525 RepID=A0AAD8BDN2_BIOPF|nr:hypothetical protein Bpfe_018187 [Biomphalaria pfeifferi]
MTAFHGYTIDINRAVKEALRVQLSNQQTKKMIFHTYVNIPDNTGFNSPDSNLTMYSSIQKDSNISENTSLSSASYWKIAEPDPRNIATERRPLPTPKHVDLTNVASNRRPLPTPKHVDQHFYGKSSNSGISTNSQLPASFQQLTGDPAKNLETSQNVQRDRNYRRLLIVALVIAIIIACCLLLLVILLSAGVINQSATVQYPVYQPSINPKVNSSQLQGTEEKTTRVNIVTGEVTRNLQRYTSSIRSTPVIKTNEMAKLTYARIIIGN